MKYITLAIIILTSAITAMAQSQTSFLDFDAGYSIHDVNSKITNGNKKLGGGLIFYGGFGHTFSKHFGIVVGVKYCTATTSTVLNYCDHIVQVTDNQLLLDNKVKDLDILYVDTKEKTTESLFVVPIGIMYNQTLGSKLKMEARLCIEPGIVTSQKYKTESGSINVYNTYINTFDGFDIAVEDVFDFNDYGSGDAGNFSGNCDMKKIIFATGASIGIVLPISNRLALTIKLYGSYTLSNQKNKDFPHIFDGQSYVGMVQSSLCSKIHPFSTGLSIGVRLSLGKEQQPLTDAK